MENRVSGHSFHDDEIYIAVGLVVGGNVLTGLSHNLLKYTHKCISEQMIIPHYSSKLTWWLSISLMVLGEIATFAAYGFGPLTRIAPLNVTNVLVNTLIAGLMFKEKIRTQDIYGIFVSLLGSFMLIYFLKNEEFMVTGKELIALFSSTSSTVYMILSVLLLGSLLMIKHRFQLDSVLMRLVVTAIVGSFTAIFAKATSSLLALSISGQMQMNHAVFWVSAVAVLTASIVEMMFMNSALKDYDSAVVLPSYFIISTIGSILAGILCYHEFAGQAFVPFFLYAFGVLMCFLGVIIITSGRDSILPSSVPTIDEPLPASPKVDNSNSFIRFFPSWLLSHVNQAQVQPVQDPFPHAMDVSAGYSYRKVSICRVSSSEDSDSGDDGDSQQETEISNASLPSTSAAASSKPPKPSTSQGTSTRPKGSGSKMPPKRTNTLTIPGPGP